MSNKGLRHLPNVLFYKCYTCIEADQGFIQKDATSQYIIIEYRAKQIKLNAQ